MLLNQVGSPAANYTSMRIATTPQRNYAPQTNFRGGFERGQLRSLLGRTLDLKSEFERVQDLFDGAYATNKAGGLAAQTSANLGLDFESTPSILRSFEEVNSTSTSYSTTSPSFEGASTAPVTIGGTYTGDVDETLTFKATSGGIVGSFFPISIEIRDEQDEIVDTVTFNGFEPAGTVKTFSNGLEISLGSGNVYQDDSFDLEVSATTGGSVDPTAQFSAQGEDAPGFDQGFAVTAGSFDLNGETINVQEGDSINSVIQTINNSSLDLTASFDSVTEKVVLTSGVSGSAETIVVSSDTSGFLAATKLDTAVVEPGHDDERIAVLANVPAFSSVTSGDFSVNGVTLSVDPNVDSMMDIINRINSSATGAVASFDFPSNSFRLESEQQGETLNWSSGSTGLFEAFRLQGGSEEVTPNRPRVRGISTDDTKSGLESLGKKITGIFENFSEGISGQDTAAFSSSFKVALLEVFSHNKIDREDDTTFDTGIGLVFEFEGDEFSVEFDQAAFNHAKKSRRSLFLELLRDGGEERPSLGKALNYAISSLEKRVSSRLGGQALDLYV